MPSKILWTDAHRRSHNFKTDAVDIETAIRALRIETNRLIHQAWLISVNGDGTISIEEIIGDIDDG